MSLINAILEQLLNGLRTGSIYALIALGYTMVYGIAKMINFAHGDIIMVGAYTLYVCVSLLHLHPILAVIITILVCALLGVVIEKIAYKPLRQAPPLAVLITAIGVSYLLQNLALLIFKATPIPFASIIKCPHIKIGGVHVSGLTIVTLNRDDHFHDPADAFYQQDQGRPGHERRYQKIKAQQNRVT